MDSNQKRTKAITAGIERKILERIIRAYPRFITPDILTTTAFISAALAAASYWLSKDNPAFLMLASAFIIIHWLADSTDGGLAVYRNQPRPNYGHYVDHMLDMISILLIGIGLAAGKIVEWHLAFAIIALFYLWTIHSAFMHKIKGTYHISYFGLGPTEGRIGLIAANTIKYWFPNMKLMNHHIINIGLAAAIAIGAAALTIKIIQTTTQLKTEDEEQLRRKDKKHAKAIQPIRSPANTPKHRTRSARKESQAPSQ